MTWQDRYFGTDDHDLLEGQAPERILEQCTDFICDALQIGPGSRVLDAGCGTGRYTVRLVKRGCLVTGVDESAYMIDRCRRAMACQSGFSAQQMRFQDVPFLEEFDAVLCWANSLGYGTRQDDEAAIRRMVAAFKPAGRILIDLHNIPCSKSTVGRTWWERETAFVLSETTYDDAGQRLTIRSIVVPKDGGEPRRYDLSNLEYRPEEIARVLEHAGVGHIEFYGDALAGGSRPLFSREGFGERSHCMIVTGRRTGGT